MNIYYVWVVLKNLIGKLTYMFGMKRGRHLYHTGRNTQLSGRRAYGTGM